MKNYKYLHRLVWHLWRLLCFASIICRLIFINLLYINGWLVLPLVIMGALIESVLTVLLAGILMSVLSISLAPIHMLWMDSLLFLMKKDIRSLKLVIRAVFQR